MQISYDQMSEGLGGIFGRHSEMAEFVNLADVKITCVPRKWTEELSLDLPEMDWEDEPLAFRL